MNELVYIYKITNMVPSKTGVNKIYVGQTIVGKNRWTTHKRLLNNNKHFNSHLQRAWNKYGGENFKFDVVLLCSVQDLNSHENFYINYWGATDRKYGYNFIDGGSGSNKVISKETRKKLSLISCGKTVSKETRDKLSRSNTGRKRSKDEIEKMSTNSILKKSVFQINIKTGEIIKTYGSLAMASKAVGLKSESTISSCCKNGRNKTAAGYFWKYKNGKSQEEIQKEITEDLLRISKKSIISKEKMIKRIESQKASVSKSVLKIDILSNEVIEKYSSISEAAKSNNISDANCIINVCKGRKEKSCGYKWRYNV